ncbi:hypothetical protein [Thioclava indica]|uniref:Uncharacterized protein n=1 Tax=Thioclava indica TaxID=1353528 RepID=A0A074JYX0_9RHOB|nr:hypothetical protein [Thioclava indica]KEO61659.1 hypothetical protein DT23_01420 [Thioclava indica]
MRLEARFFAIFSGLAVFVGLPILFYVMGDAPRRSLLKEVISIATFLSFGVMIGQFFLARSNTVLLGCSSRHRCRKRTSTSPIAPSR